MANYYPPVGFHFRVDVEGITPGKKDISFQEVSGIDVSVDTFEHKEGGENRFVHRLPDKITYDNLTLKRGLLVGSELIGWFKDSVELFRFDPRNVMVTLLNQDHEPLESWFFIQAYPVKWTIGNFDAQQNEVVIETIELSFQYFKRMEV